MKMGESEMGRLYNFEEGEKKGVAVREEEVGGKDEDAAFSG